LCRREGEKLFLKGQRCFSPKCSFEKRSYVPGAHGKTGSRGSSDRESDYARQLRAKQKARRIYGILERQFRRYFSIAQRRRGMTGLNMLQTLELRLDNVVFRMGFTENRAQARQIVTHGHFLVNGIRTDIPSVLLRPGDRLEVRAHSRTEPFFKEMPDYAEKRLCAVWLDRDVKGLSGRVVRMPERSEIDGSLNEQLIVEFYSR
jgi:small subunit ribosomal protein S4